MAAKTFVPRPMNQASKFNSQVDIIVPYHGQYDKVAALLESIFRLTRSNYYRVYVVDDCSPNASFISTIQNNANKNAQKARMTSILHAHRNETQLGFAGACKQGFLRGENPYVCFINSDCLIKDSGWLSALGESLLQLKEQGVRMVAPMTNNPVGGDPAQKGDALTRSEDNVILGDESFLTLYCFLCHRQLFERAGGFLKEYSFGYYEDEEFAARLRSYGFKQAVCRNSFVYHEGMATIKELWRGHPEIKEQMEEMNRQRCITDIQALTKK